MSSIDSPDDGMSSVHCQKNGFLTIELVNIGALSGEKAEFLTAITDGVAFVNFRAIEVGEKPMLALSYNRDAI